MTRSDVWALSNWLSEMLIDINAFIIITNTITDMTFSGSGLNLIPNTSYFKMKSTIFIILTLTTLNLRAQQVTILTKGTATSLRGMSVVTDKIIWVSGSNGRVGKSLNGGKKWTWTRVYNFEKRDFRDIEAFGKDTALIMAIAEPACILKTTNGGKTWKTVYENKSSGMFLDAMEFYDSKSGTVIGDPVNGKFFLAVTSNQGNTWREIPANDRPAANSGEACFASSGTNIRMLNTEKTGFVSGGKYSRYFSSEGSAGLPFAQGTSTSGANSLALLRNRISDGRNILVVVGGNYAADTISTNNCFISDDEGANWYRPKSPPHGYRSCVEFISQNQLVACGSSGIDISADTGMNWTMISAESFHVCQKAKKGSAVFMAGGDGKIGKLVLNPNNNKR